MACLLLWKVAWVRKLCSFVSDFVRFKIRAALSNFKLLFLMISFFVARFWITYYIEIGNIKNKTILEVGMYIIHDSDFRFF